MTRASAGGIIIPVFAEGFGEVRGKKRKILSFIMAAVVVVGIAGAVQYMLQKADDDICAAAVSNLSGNLSVVSITAEQLMYKNTENLQTIADYAAEKDNPGTWIADYCTTDGMAAVDLVMSESLEEYGSLSVPLEELDFADDRTLNGLPISKSYQNADGQWCYALSCSAVHDGQAVGTLYGEFVWETIEEELPSRLYGRDSVFLLLDGMTDEVTAQSGDTDLTAFLSCGNLSEFLDISNVQDEYMRDVFYQNKQEGLSVVFQCDIADEEHYIYMWPVDHGNAYLLGLVPNDEIMQEIPVVRHTIKFVVAASCLVSGLVIAVILIESIRRQQLQKARDKEREEHSQQLQNALDYAKAANASKTMFLSNMSHDIRTPMNAIIGFSSLLASDPSNEERVKEYTQKITASSQHLLNLINEILDISKIESGNVVLNIDRFSVKKLIADIEVITRPMTEMRKQKYTISIDALRYEVLMGDATRLSQILVNLLTNASKYTYAGGEILFDITCVQVSDNFERLRFKVKDTGIGISKEYQKEIFEPFSRAESSMTNRVQGTGLGMTITKNLVDMMGGTIEIQSEEGKGSTFTVEIAFRVPENCESNSPAEEFSDSEGQQVSDNISDDLAGLNLLVVEDNALNIELIEAMLESEGVRCEVAENGLLAVKNFESHDPGTYDAILMDVMMPVMDGYEATRKIRSLKRADAQTIPIIAITANAFAEDIKQAMNAGMNAHLAKPVNAETLKQVLLPLISRQRH